MSTVTTTLARCTQRNGNGILCWGVLATDDGSRYTGPLPCGHAAGEWLTVSATYSYDTPCDPACVYARGSECICSCGGANHSAGWIIPPVYSETGLRQGVVNDSERFRAWLLEAGRSNAIESIERRHIAARHAAETRWNRAQAFYHVIYEIAEACRTELYEVICPACAGHGLGWGGGQRAPCWRCAGTGFQEWLRDEDAEAEVRERARLEREAEHARRVAGSRHLGAAGEKLHLTLRLLRVQEFDSQYGSRFLHTFETPEGSMVKWWTTGQSPWELDFESGATWPGWTSPAEHDRYNALVADWNQGHAGQRVQRHRFAQHEYEPDHEALLGHDARICGFWFALGAELEVAVTVKAHEVFRDVRETVVTRVRIVAPVAEALPL